MDRRKEPRLRVEFPVHIWGVDRMAHPFAEVVRVKNVSLSGAVLLGVHAKVCAGGLLDVQHGSQRAQFRIAWAASGEAGIEALPSEPCIWRVAYPKMLNMVGTG
ncbi:MAG: hypothetical protein WAL71_12670 [Terriglobales bacterium]|jgi:hypothetical protein